METLPGNPLILYVDDEELLREVASIMIEDHGGRCIVACDGRDALTKFQEQSGEIDFVYMDYSMPEMNGYETIVEIRKIRPDIPIVVVSGLDISPEVEELRQQGKVGFLSKPFREVDLIDSFRTYTGQ
ncbi:MAG: response regulator [Bdellovibrionales bacterium]|nr:response regulator [Bdellovibrionales bacterium]